MNSFAQHIAVLLFCMFYFSGFGDKTAWVWWIVVNSIIGLFFSFYR